MRKLLVIAVAGLLVTACSDDVTEVTEIVCTPKIFVPGTTTAPLPNTAASWQPCTVPVNFTVDDSAAEAFGNGEMHWKGSWQYDQATRIAYYDASWGPGGNGPHIPLYDDGPWTTGGHEPVGEVANDHVFGATVFVQNPAAAVTFGYGLVDHTFGDGWIWPGPNGSFVVNPGASTPIDAQGLVRPAPGTTDLRLELDTAALKLAGEPPVAWPYLSPVRVKGLAWGWYEVPMYDDGTNGDTTADDGVWTFELSDWTGPGNPARGGLLSTGEWPFVFVLGPDGDEEDEYKAPTPPTEGVTAFLKASGATDWTATTVTTQPAGDKNTLVTVP